jgi:hypothetical protein
MLRRRPTADSNAGTAVVPVFGVDPRGAALFAGAVNGTMGALNGRVVMDTRSTAWHGWTQSPQNFRSPQAVTGIAAGAGRPSVATSTFLDQSRSSAQLSPMQALMEARAARGRY